MHFSSSLEKLEALVLLSCQVFLGAAVVRAQSPKPSGVFLFPYCFQAWSLCPIMVSSSPGTAFATVGWGLHAADIWDRAIVGVSERTPSQGYPVQRETGCPAMRSCLPVMACAHSKNHCI